MLCQVTRRRKALKARLEHPPSPVDRAIAAPRTRGGTTHFFRGWPDHMAGMVTALLEDPLTWRTTSTVPLNPGGTCTFTW